MGEEEGKTFSKSSSVLARVLVLLASRTIFRKVSHKRAPNIPCMGKVLDSLAEREHFRERKSLSFEANNFSFSFIFGEVQVAANLSDDFSDGIYVIIFRDFQMIEFASDA